MGAWVAVRGSIFTLGDLPAWILLATVTFWIGGFDIYYSCQDVDFDRENHLYSIPARFGVARALQVAGISHIITVVLFFILGFVALLGWPYWFGVAIMAALLAYEHLLVRPDDLSNLDLAFFNINGYISVIIFLATAVAVIIA
jgi:4-hydroxybenzoate polyprenyltransferase